MTAMRSALLAGLVSGHDRACRRAGRAAAKAPPEEALALPSDTLIATWGILPTAAPLGAGRWAVISSDFDAAVIADFNAKTLTPLGEPGKRRTCILRSCSPWRTPST